MDRVVIGDYYHMTTMDGKHNLNETSTPIAKNFL